MQVGSCFAGDDLVCRYSDSDPPQLTNKHLCLPQHYNKFDLPFPNDVNPIDIGIDITDVLRINDKVRSKFILIYHSLGISIRCTSIKYVCILLLELDVNI